MALMIRWNKILSCRDIKEVYIDATEEDLARFYDNYAEDYSYKEDFVSPITQLIRDEYISPMPAKQKILEIKKNPNKVLDDPSAVYFLDVTKEEATNIQKQYGVICKNENDIDDTELGEWSEIISSQGDLDHNWNDFLAKIKKSPTNTVIINDRFVFSNDDFATKKCQGINNIINMLDALLPDTFSKDFLYHVLILYSDKNSKGESTCKIQFNKLSKKLSESIINLRKEKYNILVEVIAIPGSSFGYDYTHNRRVITNYHIIRSEHKLVAFSGKKSLCSQTLNWDSLFSKGIIDNNDISYKNYKIILKNVVEINKFGKRNPEKSMYKYSYDGICPKSENDKSKIIFSEIQNRLVKSAII